MSPASSRPSVLCRACGGKNKPLPFTVLFIAVLAGGGFYGDLTGIRLCIL